MFDVMFFSVYLQPAPHQNGHGTSITMPLLSPPQNEVSHSTQSYGSLHVVVRITRLVVVRFTRLVVVLFSLDIVVHVDFVSSSIQTRTTSTNLTNPVFTFTASNWPI